MRFQVLPQGHWPPTDSRSSAFLLADNWNDWFKYITLFQLVVFDDRGNRAEIGSVKIGQYGWGEAQTGPDIPIDFPELDERFFSVGQDESYYENLNSLGQDLRDSILRSLRDFAFDLSILDRAEHEEITTESLLRSVSITTVRGQFHRLAHGGARLSRYDFQYHLADTPTAQFRLDFSVTPESHPPTNIHVLIGRNGVGKTRLLHSMTNSLLSERFAPNAAFRTSAAIPPDGLFANLVSVTFSAFDPFDPPTEPARPGAMRYAYIGLKHVGPTAAGRPKTVAELTAEFARSHNECRFGAKRRRFLRALQVLEADPLFREAGISALAQGPVPPPPPPPQTTPVAHTADVQSAVFERLSSGHKIVLLTITRLIEVVEERTLVLLDEPEAHLHPPLLSAFIRALSDLLTDRNGVAIIATHSPVILQEVPRSCVYKLHRSGATTWSARPDLETFGENVGILTREVFGLEVTDSGFHRLLTEAVATSPSFDEVLQRFSGQLGDEAKAIVRALFAARGA